MKIIKRLFRILNTRLPYWNLKLPILFFILSVPVFLLLKKSKYKFSQKIIAIILYFYSFNVVVSTLLMRTPQQTRIYNLIPLSSFFMPQDSSIAEFVFNMALFLPLGVLIPCLLKRKNKEKTTMLIGFSSSMLIEIIQLIRKLGELETDDIIANTLGVLIGILIYKIIVKRHQERTKIKSNL